MLNPNRSPHDPLLLQEPLEHRIQFPVLGIPVRFATNDRGVLDQIVGVFGHWRGADATGPLAAGTDIRIFVHDGDEGPSSEPPVRFRAPDPMRWIVHTPGSVGIADLERRVGVAYVTRALIADAPRFRVSVLHFLVFIILTIEDRTPVHAAMIGSGDAALLLAGPAGSGKSTLAYAAFKSGVNVFSDDAAYIQLEPRRVWGSSPGILLLREAADRFPELKGFKTTLFATGKRKVMVGLFTENPPRWASRARVCLLERSGGPVRVTRIGPDEIRKILTHDPAGAGGRFGTRLEDAAAWLSEPGGWRISLSADPMEAAPLLLPLLAEVASGG